MFGLQQFIHDLEIGRGPRIVRFIVFVLAVAVLTFWYNQRELRNFSNPEAMEAAQLARNLAEGKGFTTHCIRPLTLQLVEDRLGPAHSIARAPHPDLVNPPLYPLMLAGLMKVFPFEFEIDNSFRVYQPELTIAFFNQTLFFITILLTWWLGRKLFDEGVASLAAIALAGSDLLWKFSGSGLPTMLLLLLLVSLIWCLVKIHEAGLGENPSGRRIVGWSVAAAVVLGLGGLTQYSFLWLTLPVLAFVGVAATRVRWLSLLTIVLLVGAMIGPWMARNYQLSGTLFGVPGYAPHQDTLLFTENRLERSFEVNTAQLDRADYVRKFFFYGGEIVRGDLPRLGGSWVAAFFLPGLFMVFRNPVLNRLRFFTVGTLLLLVVVQALGRTHLTTSSPTVTIENLLVLLTPIVFVFGVGFYAAIVDQMQLPIPELRHLVNLLFASVACAPLIFTLLPPRNFALSYPPYYPAWIQEAGGFFDEDELIMSDMPWAMAWYGDRDCVWTPLKVGNPRKNPPELAESFYTVNDEHKKVSGLLLTPISTNVRFLRELLQGQNYEWSRFLAGAVLQTNLPSGFPLIDARARYLPDQLLLADRKRWLEKDRRSREVRPTEPRLDEPGVDLRPPAPVVPMPVLPRGPGVR